MGASAETGIKQSKVQEQASPQNASNLSKQTQFKITDPELFCPNLYKMVYVCINKKCSETNFSCDKIDCSSCYVKHEYCGKMIKLEKLTKQLQIRYDLEKKFLDQFQKIQSKVIQALQARKKVIVNKYHFLKGFDNHYADLVEGIYIKKDTKHLEGHQIEQFAQKLKLINEATVYYSQKFTKQFKQYTKTTIENWVQYQNKIIDKFLTCARENSENIDFPTPFDNYRNPHRSKFDSSIYSNGIRITYKDSDTRYYSFIKNGQISKDVVSNFYIKQEQTTKKFLGLGICTDKVFGITDGYYNEQAITYWSWSGKVWQNGHGRDGGRTIQDGEIIKLTIDPLNWRITWSIQQEQLASAIIPLSMLNSPLYLMILMYWKNDMVQVLFNK